MNGELKIADFGVSAQVVKTLDQKSTYVGTEKYMAPERIQGPKHGSESDIWSLGVIAFECYYGQNTIMYDNQIDFIEKYKRFTMPKDAPADFKDFVMGCLKFDPQDRYTATQLLEHPWLQMARNIENDGKTLEYTCKYLEKVFSVKK